MVELREMPEPDGPLTPEQLEKATRTFFCEEMMRSGMEPEEAEIAWNTSVEGERRLYREKLRGPLSAANAHWGRHVRQRQAEVLRTRGSYQDTVTALSIIISQAEDSVVAARLIRDLLDLP